MGESFAGQQSRPFAGSATESSGANGGRISTPPRTSDGAAMRRLRALETELQQTRENLQSTVQELDTRNNELRTALRRLRMVLGMSSDMVLLLDRDSMRLVDANAAACTGLGYSRDELLQMDPDALRSGVLTEELMQWLTALNQSPQEPLVVESVYRCKGGSRMPVEVSLQGFEDDGRRYIFAMAHDIIGRYHEDALRACEECEERYRSLVTALNTMVWTMGPEGTFISPQIDWQTYTGQSWEAHRGWGWLQAFHPEDRAGIRRQWRRVVKLGDLYDAEGRLWHAAQKRYRHVHLKATPLRHADGSLREWIGIVDDVENRKQAEHLLQEAHRDLERRVADRTAALERSMTDLDAFAYVASHDLKAPLRAIDNLARWIHEDAFEVLPENSQRHLRTLQQRVARLDKLLDDLLAYSRSDREAPTIEVVDTGVLLSAVTDMLIPPAGFTIRVAADMPTFTAAKVPLEQIFRNLIDNAIKHHDRSDGQVEITARDTGEWWEFAVADDGPGIPAAYHERIFQMFQTLKPRDQVEGSGIGLAVVYKLVTRRGGTIAVESAEGRGACFRFTWPKQEPGWD